MARSFQRDTDGTAAIIPWMVGAMVFSASFFYVSNTVMETPRDLFNVEAHTLSVGATSLSDILFGAGEGWTDPGQCTSTDNQTTTTFEPDGTTRLGLGVDSCETDQIDSTGNLSYEKLENLNQGETEADPDNGLVDYEEARDSLDLTDESLDFHLRTWPNLPSADEVLRPGGREAPVHPAYLADYEPSVAASEPEDKKAEKKDGSAYAPSVAAIEEVRLLGALSRNFEPEIASDEHDGTAIPATNKGDVLPDQADTLHAMLEERLLDKDGNADLTDRTTLVIGSGVDAASLESSAHTLATWVLGGGTIIVLGTPTLEPTWMASLFAQARETAGGPTRNPDPGHPVLHSPNQLDYANYQAHVTPVSPSGDARELFTHVAVTDFGDLLAVSNPGVFGEGRVLASAWQPGRLVEHQDAACPADLTQATNCEPLLLLHNLVSVTLGELYVDFGPEVPLTAPAGDETRLAYTFHPELQETIPLSVELYVFPRFDD